MAASNNRMYKKLKELKEASNLSYSELLEMLVESYERSRLEVLHKVVERFRLPDEKIEEDKEVSQGAERGVVGAVLDTSVLLEILDAGNTELLDASLARYDGMLIPWVALYEYLYGHAYVGNDVRERRRFVEELGDGCMVGPEDRTKSIRPERRSLQERPEIPFSDPLIAALALEVEGELVTLNERHFKRVKGSGYMYQDLCEALLIIRHSNAIATCVVKLKPHYFGREGQRVRLTMFERSWLCDKGEVTFGG
jgi:predicted nucleic acid-binding protein